MGGEGGCEGKVCGPPVNAGFLQWLVDRGASCLYPGASYQSMRCGALPTHWLVITIM